jgi:hypothetical protein
MNSSSLTIPLASMVSRYSIERRGRKRRPRFFFYMGCRRPPGCINRFWNRRDDPRAEVHILDAGHFALDLKPKEVIRLTGDFMKNAF